MSTIKPINLFAPYQRIVIKIGSAILLNKTHTALRLEWLASLIEDIMALRGVGKEVLIVTSGSIALGRMNLAAGKKRVLRLEEKQAAAAIGQPQLVAAYGEAFAPFGVNVAQILLTYEDTEQRHRHLNARHTITTLLEMGYIPIINENDSVATAEIRYGDNDRLAARVGTMVSADLVILLSDIDGLYTANPNEKRNKTKAKHIPEIHDINADIMAMAGPVMQNGISSGGMKTKLEAAKIAVSGGAGLMIAKGEHHHPLRCLDKNHDNHQRHSLFHPISTPLQARKSWIAGSLKTKGSLIIDDGACRALRKGGSLLPSGIVRVIGKFHRGDPVTILQEGDQSPIARGLSSYDHLDIVRIQGQHSSKIQAILGYAGRSAVIHRDDLVLIKDSSH